MYITKVVYIQQKRRFSEDAGLFPRTYMPILRSCRIKNRPAGVILMTAGL